MDLETIRQEARAVAEELITTAQMKPGQILVVGCSSSEIHNSKLGTDSSQEIGQAVFEALCACTKEHGLYLAAQCCEHLNRAVVLERAAAEKCSSRSGPGIAENDRRCARCLRADKTEIHRRRADALRGRSGDEKVRNCDW